MFTTDDTGDVCHYFFTCDFLKTVRKLYLKPYFYVKPNIRNYRELFTSTKYFLTVLTIYILVEK